METITIKCEKCKNRFMIENVTGVYLCTVCDCKNEHYVFPNSFTDEQIIKANKMFKDLKKVYRKYDVDYTDIEIMQHVVVSLINK